MKKEAMVLLVICIVFSFMVPSVMAASKKPPKKFCCELDANGEALDGTKLVFATKKTGMKVKDSRGKVSFYTIHGAMTKDGHFYNIEGSGYMDGPDFEGHISGRLDRDVVTCNLFYRYYDPHIISCSVAPDINASAEYSLIEIDCKSLTLD